MSSQSFLRAEVASFDASSGDLVWPMGRVEPPARRAHVLLRDHGAPIAVVEVSGRSDRDLVDAATAELARVMAGRPQVERGAGGRAAHHRHRRLTIAIASRNNVEQCTTTVVSILDAARSAFAAGDDLPVEVLVVDNGDAGGSGEGSLEAAIAALDPGGIALRCVREPKRGLSRARNRALAVAEDGIILFTDDDVLPDPTWLPSVVRAFDSDPEVVCVTGPILAGSVHAPAQWWLEQYGGFGKGFDRQVFDMGENRRDDALYPYDAGRFGSGANIAFDVTYLRALGGFAESLGAGTPARGGEDLDVLSRTVRSGRRLVYEPEAIVWHRHRESYVALRRQMLSYGIGVTATVTKWVLDDRRTAADVARRAVVGLVHLLAPGSAKNRRKTSSYPVELTRLERLGMLLGPIAYLRSRIAARRADDGRLSRD